MQLRPTIALGALVSALFLPACGAKEKSAVLGSAEYAEATQAINDHDYARALSLLDSLPPSREPEVVRKRMHALAGASGFEAIKFKEQMQAVRDRIDTAKVAGANFLPLSDDGKKAPKKFTFATVWNFRLAKVTNHLKTILQEAPAPDEKAKLQLDQAIALYAAQGWTPATANPEDNFRWGVLYGYRASTRVAEAVRTLDDLATNQDVCRSRALEARTIELLILTSSDMFSVFQMFEHSYLKVRKLSAKVSESLGKVTKSGFPLPELLETPERRDLLLRSFFVTNTAGISDVLALRWLAKGKLRLACPDATQKDSFLERFKHDRGRAAARVFGAEYLQKGTDATYYSPRFFDEMAKSSASLDAEKGLRPLTDIADTEGTQAYRLAELLRAVADPSNEGTGGELAAQADLLRPQVDKAQVALLAEDQKSIASEAEANGATVDESEAAYLQYASAMLNLSL